MLDQPSDAKVPFLYANAVGCLVQVTFIPFLRKTRPHAGSFFCIGPDDDFVLSEILRNLGFFNSVFKVGFRVSVEVVFVQYVVLLPKIPQDTLKVLELVGQRSAGHNDVGLGVNLDIGLVVLGLWAFDAVALINSPGRDAQVPHPRQLAP